MYPCQRCNPPAGAQVDELKTFRARPSVILAPKQARLAIARRANCNAAKYLRLRADLPLMKVEKRALSEQLDPRNHELRDCVLLYTTVGAANNCSFVGKAIHQLGKVWRGAVAIVKSRKEIGYEGI